MRKAMKEHILATTNDNDTLKNAIAYFIWNFHQHQWFLNVGQ